MGTHAALDAEATGSALPGPSARASRSGRMAALQGPAGILLLITLAAAALRFATLDVQSIWLDESATLLLVHRGFAGMLSHLSSSESAPPLYYVLVWAWTKAFGAGPLGFRSFSALVGTLTVPVLYLAARRASPRAGLWAAALAAFNPVMYYYSQEARCYALLILLSAAAFVLWQDVLARPSARRLALWSLVSILAVLSHYFAAFLFIPEAIVLIRRLGLRRTLAPIGAVAAVGLALVPLAVSQHGNGRKSEWIEQTSLASRVGETAKAFLVGLYGPLEILTAALVGLLVLAALVLLVRRGSQGERHVARDAAIVAFTAVLLPLVAAVAHVIDLFDGRNVIGAWGPMAALIGVGLGVAGARRAGAVAGLGILAVSLAVIAAVNLTPGYQRDDWRGAARALGARRSAERLIVTEQYGSLPLSIYLSGTRVLKGAASTREVDFIVLRTRRTGRSPLAPTPPTRAPSGFRLAGARATESYAVSRFLAPRARVVTLAELRRLTAPSAEATLQR